MDWIKRWNPEYCNDMLNSVQSIEVWRSDEYARLIPPVQYNEGNVMSAGFHYDHYIGLQVDSMNKYEEWILASILIHENRHSLNVDNRVWSSVALHDKNLEGKPAPQSKRAMMLEEAWAYHDQLEFLQYVENMGFHVETYTTSLTEQYGNLLQKYKDLKAEKET